MALVGDLRSSTPRILGACAQAVQDLGGEPVFCGLVPTPAMALWAFKHKIPSIMVTGSHIPDDRNGIKFYPPDGEILKQDEIGIRQQKVPMSLPVDGPLPIESRAKAKNVVSIMYSVTSIFLVVGLSQAEKSGSISTLPLEEISWLRCFKHWMQKLFLSAAPICLFLSTLRRFVPKMRT